MVNRKEFASLLGALLLAFFLIACQRSSAPNRSASGLATSTSSFAPAKPSPTPDGRPIIVAFGNSLTAGFGLPEDQTFTALLQRKIDEKGYRYRVENLGVSGDTSAGGVSRIDWALNLDGQVKFLILELGGNDGLRALPVAEMKKNLAEIIERAQARGVTVILAGMEAPPNLGEQYTSEFRQSYRDLAKKYRLTLIPFILEGVAGNREMNQPDGIHPNSAGEKVMTENVWRELEPLLLKNSGAV